MVKRNAVVISAPVGHELDLFKFYFADPLTEEIQRTRPDVKVIETDGTVTMNDQAIKSLDPAVFYSCGHGFCFVHTVECKEEYLVCPGECVIHFECNDEGGTSSTSLRLEMMVGRHVHLLSCLTGLILGPTLIANGARSYIGYNDVFYASYCSVDADAEAEREIILKGSTVDEAVVAMIAKYLAYIGIYDTGELKDQPEAPWEWSYLEHDLEHLVYLGDMNWRPCPTCARADLWPDGRIDMKDIAVVCKAYGSVPGSPRWNPACDFNNDGRIDMKDIAFVCRCYGQRID
jgi:hypothetical protein